ncbi:unnamed protein product [Prorocentrum cordatum]|uniref:Pentatricopeptide repeat-containing protein n=1 Tax=Prorocentrum cordatum TaxID=2364126 RepID=A0ABN9SP58_9DINO|nr:unnamed protein product [Polarella glacialis]
MVVTALWMPDCQQGSSQGAFSFRAAITTRGSTHEWTTAVRACGKHTQWQQALSLLRNMVETKLEPSVISYSTGISVCRKGGQWKQALLLFSEMLAATLELDVISYSAGISACEKGGQWRQAI